MNYHWHMQDRWLQLLLVSFIVLPAVSLAADKINTSYISTSPGSSTVIQVAKDIRIFDKYGLDPTVIFISGSVRGIQAILAGEIPIGEGGGPGLASARLAGGDVVAIAGSVGTVHSVAVAEHETAVAIDGVRVADEERPRGTAQGIELSAGHRRPAALTANFIKGVLVAREVILRGLLNGVADKP